MGRKESNQTNKLPYFLCVYASREVSVASALSCRSFNRSSMLKVPKSHVVGIGKQWRLRPAQMHSLARAFASCMLKIRRKMKTQTKN